MISQERGWKSFPGGKKGSYITLVPPPAPPQAASDRQWSPSKLKIGGLEVRGWNEKRIGKVQLGIGKIGLYLCCISVIMSAC